MGHVLIWVGGWVLIILVVVGIHEGGHFAVAKWSGIRVDEFAIGFGPRLLSRRRGETVYSFRALPLGGFVKMPGMSSLEEDDGGERGFMRASIPRRMATLLAGVTMNFLLAGILFTVAFMPGVASRITAAGPLDKAGFRDGDSIVSVDGRAVDHTSLDTVTADLHAAAATSQGRPVSIVYTRSSEQAAQRATVTPYLSLLDSRAPGDGLAPALVVTAVDGHPVTAGDPATLLGHGGTVTVAGYSLDDPSRVLTATVSGVVGADSPGAPAAAPLAAAWRFGLSPDISGEPFGRAIADGFGAIPRGIGATLKTIGDAIAAPSSGAVDQFHGPVGIARITEQATRAGWVDYIAVMGSISLALGIINVLPIPPFDGGRFAIIAAEALTRRRLDARREMAFIVAGVMLIIMFVVFVTLHNDIQGF